MSGTAADLAAEALRLAGAEPGRAADLATTALSLADGKDPGVAADATRALGLAHREANQLARSSRELRRSIRLARRAGDRHREAEAVVSLAFNQSLAGRTRDALAGLDAAEALAPELRVAAGGQRALVLMRAGRFADALAAYEPAVREARRLGQCEVESKFLNNRALLHCWRGATDLAERDLMRASALSAEVGDEAGVASAGHNLGWVLGRRGDVPGALAAFDAAEARYAALGMGDDELLVDRAELLLRAHLVAEALSAAERVVGVLRVKRVFADLAVARVLLAEAQMLAGRPEDARRTASAAATAFRKDGRTAWAVLARAGAVRARVASSTGAPPARLLHDLVASADELETAGWTAPALDARLAAARLAFARGDLAAGAAAVDRARAARHRGPADLRVRAWHAEALARVVAGDRRGADRALRRGLDVLDEHRATLGATELRAHAASHGEDLTGLGLGLAIEGGRPASVLAWAEHQRAQSLRFRPVRPPDDPELATALAALRGVVADLDQALLEGDDPRRLLARQAGLEREVNRLTRRAIGSGDVAARWARGHLLRLRSELATAGAGLVSYLDGGDHLVAVVVDGRGVTLHELGPLDAVSSEVDSIAFALRRLARPGVPPATADAARAALQRAGAVLDRMLIEPLGVALAHGPLVIVPTGALHGLAWAALPSLRDRTVAVAPSASVWLEAVERGDDGDDGDGRVAVIAGPNLEAADEEAGAVGALHPAAVVLDSSSSSVGSVLDAMDGARLVHLATHGRFRADNPLFSSLLVADGPLLVHDLGRLHAAPSLVVLSACDSASSGSAAADELLGMLAVLFSLGTRGVVASVVPVPDHATRRLMEDLHRALAGGRAAAPALAAARRGALATGAPDDLVAALAFNAYGDVLDPA